MKNSKQDKSFDDTLKRLMEKPPKPQEDMKKGREQKPAPDPKKIG